MSKSDKYQSAGLPFLSESPHSDEQDTPKRKAASQEPVSRKKADTPSTTATRRNTTKSLAKQQTSLLRGSTFYLQLHSDNLAIYLNCGLFYPVAWEPDATYKENRAARPDILTRFPHHLAFSTGILGALREHDILLEIALTPQEQEQLHAVSPCLLYPDALPVSRIQQIMFASDAAKQEYLASREVFDDSFFPDKLVIAKSPFLSKSPLPSSLAEPSATNGEEFAKRAARFNKVLGLFAFMKNAPLLRANYTGKLVDWDASFLTALALVNRATGTPPPTNAYIFRASLAFEQIAISDNTTERQRLFHDIVTHIYTGGVFTYKWAATTLETYKELQPYVHIFEDLQADGTISFVSAIEIFRRTSERTDQNIPLILLVLLGRFSNRDRMHTDKQAVRIYFTQGETITESEAAVCTAILGLYYGYQSMVRDDRNLQIKDRFFSALAPGINRIKFQLDRFLDRYVVESVFQYAYKQVVVLEDTFDYLRSKQEHHPATPSPPIGYTSRPFVVLGQSIVNAEQSKWTSYVERLPLSVPLSHPAISVLSTLGAGIPRDVIGKMLDNLPKEYEGATMAFLNAIQIIQKQK
jgi:hypothetical protein